MPFWNSLLNRFQPTLLNAAGQAVGLPAGYDGNSEVGHRTIGSGNITPTILSIFHHAIETNELQHHKILISLLSKLKTTNGRLHLIGLLSDAGVHSHDKHLHALIQMASSFGIHTVTHAILDGRDTPPTSAAIYLKRLDEFPTLIGSLHGRFFAMDRDNNWHRTEQSYRVLTGQTSASNCSWSAALKAAYSSGETDEFVTPILLTPTAILKQNDALLFFNFRSDRARQLASPFTSSTFSSFPTTHHKLTFFASATQYSPDFSNPILFEQPLPTTSLLDEIANQTHKPVFTIAETEKYAHVTYFFRESRVHPGPVITSFVSANHATSARQEESSADELISAHLIPSIKTKTYATCPEMSAAKITEAIIQSLATDPAQFYLVNYANPDMVGHSGDFKATIQACEFVDIQLKRLYDAFAPHNATLFITGDHGNAEQLFINGHPKTSHTTNPVPFLATINPIKQPIPLEQLTPTHGLANIAPTILKTMQLKIPAGMATPIS